MDYFVAPSGVDGGFGTSKAPWSFERLMRHQPQPGDTIRLLAGGTYPGHLRWFSLQDPDRPVTLGRYGEGPNPVIASGNQRGLWCGGLGGLSVAGVDFAGSGEAGVEVNNDGEGRPAWNYQFEGVGAEGYTLGGIVISANTPISGVLVRACRLHHNANGLFVSGAEVDGSGRNVICNVTVEDTDCSDNYLPNAASTGNGMSLVGVDGLLVRYSRAFRNGSAGGQGHSGITAQQCRDVEIGWNHTGGTLPGPAGDGQNIVCNSCERFDVHHNTMEGGNVGASAHDDREAVGPGYPSRRGRIRNNVIVNPAVGIQVWRTLGDVWIEDNDIWVHSLKDEYRKCFSFDGPHDGRIFVRGNSAKATGDSKAMGALLLEAAYGAGLRDVWFGGSNTWEWESWNHRPFRVLGQDYATLTEAARG